MIVKIEQTGYSFKGLGKYLLHDRQADTSERVEWLQTINTLSDDPNKAIKEMIWISSNADYLKKRAGVSTAGRKQSGKNVLPMSLSWHPSQVPSEEEMREAARSALELHGLEEHQALLVAHNDANSEFRHVHIMVNLVNPNTGKVNVLSNGKRKFSLWAEEYEKNQGKIYCEERVKNNEQRRQNALKPEGERKRIKYQEKALPIREQLREFYAQSDNLASFQSALKSHGYELAEGRKGRMVIIDKNGHTTNLVRQLQGVRTKDVREKYPGIQNGLLAKVEDVLARQEQERQKEMSRRDDVRKPDSVAKGAIKTEDQTEVKPLHEELDKIQRWELWAEQKRATLRKQQQDSYNLKDLKKNIRRLEERLKKVSGPVSKKLGRHKEIQELLEVQRLNLANIEQRITEQNAKLDIELEASKKQELGQSGTAPAQEKRVEPSNDKSESSDLENYIKAKRDKNKRNRGGGLKR